MASETQKITPSKVTTAKLIEAARKALSKLLPPGKSIPADVERQLCKLLTMDCPTPDHPPYSLMIREAIWKLLEEGGSDEETISKSIKLKYKRLPRGHTILLGQHLKKLNKEGELVCLDTGRYILPHVNSDTIGPDKKKEEIDDQRDISTKDVSQSSREANLECESIFKYGVDHEVDSEQTVAGVGLEGIEKQDELKDHIPGREQPKSEDPSLLRQECRLIFKRKREDQVLEERRHERIVDAVSKQIQSQDQFDELLRSEPRYLTQQDEMSLVEASEMTSKVCAGQDDDEMEDVDQIHDGDFPTVGREIAEQEIYQNQNMEDDADQVPDVTSLVEGEKEEGRQVEEATGDMKEVDDQETSKVCAGQDDDKPEDVDQIHDGDFPTVGREIAEQEIYQNQNMEDDADQVPDVTSLVEGEKEEGRQVEEATGDMKEVDDQETSKVCAGQDDDKPEDVDQIHDGDFPTVGREIAEQEIYQNQNMEDDADQVPDITSLVKGEKEEGRQVKEADGDMKMEDDADQVPYITSLVEGEKEEGRQVKEADEDMKEVDDQESEMAEETLPEEAQRGELNILEQVQEEPNLLVLEGQTVCQEPCQLTNRQNQEDVIAEKQIEKELNDALVPNQRDHMVNQKNQPTGVQYAIIGPVFLHDMEIEIEDFEKLIESWKPEYEVIWSKDMQREKHAGVDSTDSNRQDKGLELLDRIKGIKTCLSGIFKSAVGKERPDSAGFKETEPEVPRNQQGKTEVCIPRKEVIYNKEENSGCLEPMDVMLIEANQYIHYLPNPKRPADSAVKTFDNITQRQAKQRKLFGRQDVENASGISVFESPVHSFKQDNADPAMLRNQAVRSDVSTEIQCSSLEPTLEKLRVLSIKEGEQTNFGQHPGQDMNQERLKQQTLVSCAQHKNSTSKPYAVQFPTKDSSPITNHQPLEQVGVLLNHEQPKPIEDGATSMPPSPLTPSCLPHLSPAEVAHQWQSRPVSENFGLSFSNPKPPGELQKPSQEQLELPGIECSLSKLSVLSSDTLNPSKPAKLKKIEPAYRTKLRSCSIASPLGPELGPSSDRTLTRQSGSDQSKEKLPLRRGRPLDQTNIGGEESPLSQKRHGKPPKPKPDAEEGSQLIPKRRKRPPK